MESTLALPSRPGARPQPRSAGAVLALLERIEHGTLEIRLPDGSQQRFGQTGPIAATLEVADWSMFDAFWNAAMSASPMPGSTATGTARIWPPC
jgi:hypothetical protein